MLIDWPRDFDRQYDRIEADTSPDGQLRFEYLLALLDHLADLEVEPSEDTATLKRVRQSRKYPVWRLAHPFNNAVAVRVIAWFPPNSSEVVVALFAGDKKNIGDVWYDAVGTRADQLIENWLRERKADQ
jgi:hypothetical protein